MKIHYDDAVDAVTPHGAVEFTDGINMDTTSDGHIAGIEIPESDIPAIKTLRYAPAS